MQNFMKKVTLVLMIIPTCITVTLLTSSTNIIMAEYAQYPLVLVTGVLTVHNLTTLVGLILSPVLLPKISAKKLAIFGMSLYLVATTLPYWITNFYVFFLLRVLAGIGCGMILPIQATYVATYPKKERANLMGITTTVVALIAAGLVAISGFVAADGWRNVFLMYFINVIPLVLMILFLPKNPVAADVSEESEEAVVTGEGSIQDFIPVMVIYYIILSASYLVVSMLGVELAPYMADAGLGSGAESGLLMSFSLLGSVVSGLVFSAYLNHLKSLVMPSVFLFTAVACGIMWLAGSLVPVAVGVFIMGFYSAMIAVAVNYELSLVLPLQVYTAASAVTNLFTFVLQFFSPMVFLAVLGLTQGSFRGVFFVYMIFQAVMVPVAMVLTRKLKKA